MAPHRPSAGEDHDARGEQLSMPPPLAGGETRPLLFGTTSYVLPDDVLANVRLLAPLVDDIELVLFEGEASNLPSAAEVREMRFMAEAGGSGFTVHLPLDVGIGEPDTAARRQAQDTCLRVIDLTAILEPRAFVAHPELPLVYHPPLGEMPEPAVLSPEMFAAWQAALGESLERLAAEVGPFPLAVENLMFPYEWAYPVVDALELGVVFDVGHLLVTGGTVADHLAAYGDRLTVVHLHAVVEGRDHRELGGFARDELVSILELVARSGPRQVPLVVDVEVFGWQHTVPSLRTLASLYGEDGDGGRFARAADGIAAALPPETLTS